MILSTYLRNQMSPKGIAKIAARGWIPSWFITQHQFFTAGDRAEIKAKELDKHGQYTEGYRPDYDMVDTIIDQINDDYSPFGYDHCPCWNYENPHWALTGQDFPGTSRRRALAEFSGFMGHVLAKSRSDLCPGSWGTAMVHRVTLQPIPWRVAASRMSKSLHMNGYYKRPEHEELDFIRAQMNLALNITDGPIRLWVWPRCVSGELMPLDYLRRIGELVRPFGWNTDRERIGVTLFGTERFDHPDWDAHQIDQIYMNAAFAIADGVGM